MSYKRLHPDRFGSSSRPVAGASAVVGLRKTPAHPGTPSAQALLPSVAKPPPSGDYHTCAQASQTHLTCGCTNPITDSPYPPRGYGPLTRPSAKLASEEECSCRRGATGVPRAACESRGDAATPAPATPVTAAFGVKSALNLRPPLSGTRFSRVQPVAGPSPSPRGTAPKGPPSAPRIGPCVNISEVSCLGLSPHPRRGDITSASLGSAVSFRPMANTISPSRRHIPAAKHQQLDAMLAGLGLTQRFPIAAQAARSMADGLSDAAMAEYARRVGNPIGTGVGERFGHVRFPSAPFPLAPLSLTSSRACRRLLDVAEWDLLTPEDLECCRLADRLLGLVFACALFGNRAACTEAPRVAAELERCMAQALARHIRCPYDAPTLHGFQEVEIPDPGRPGGVRPARIYYPSGQNRGRSRRDAPILLHCGSYPLVVFVHGQPDSCEDEPDTVYARGGAFLERLAEVGFVVVAPFATDLYPDSFPDTTRGDAVLARVHNWVHETWRYGYALLPGRFTTLIGHSFGSNVVASYSARLALGGQPPAARGVVAPVWRDNGTEAMRATSSVPTIFAYGEGDSFAPRDTGVERSADVRRVVQVDSDSHWLYADGAIGCLEPTVTCSAGRTLGRLVGEFFAEALGTTVPRRRTAGCPSVVV